MEKTFFWIIILSYTSAFLEDANKVQSLNDCVEKFVDEWKINNYNTSYLYLTVVNVDSDLKLDALHKLNDIQFVSRKTFQYTYVHSLPSDAYLLMSENYTELKVTLTKLSADLYWNPTVRFIIVINDVGDDINYTCRLLHKHNMFNVILITYQNNDYAIYEYNVTSNVPSMAWEHLVFVSWSSKYIDRNSQPALVKRVGLRGYEFEFIAPDIWPFTNCNKSNMEGIEQYLLNLFEDYTGIKINIVVQPKFDKYGNVTANFTKNMLQRVHKGEFEGTVGGYSIRTVQQFYEYASNLSYTYPLAVDNLVYVLPRAIPLTPWIAVLNRCSFSCAVAGFLFLILCAAAMLLAVFPLQKKQNCRDISIVFGYILNKTSVKGSRFPQRLIVTAILYFAFIMPYVLQASLYSVMTSPVSGYEAKSVKELSTKRLILYTEGKQAKVAVKYERDCDSLLSCLLEVKNSPDKSFYTIVANSYYNIYRPQLIDDNCKLGVYRLKDAYVMLLRVVFLRRGSVLVEPFNVFVFNSMSTGLVNKYAGDLYRKHGKKWKRLHQISRTSLKLLDLYGAFVILIVGNCLSVIVFVCEIIISKNKTVV